MFLSFLALSALSLIQAAYIPAPVAQPRANWHHEADHPVTRLFPRGTANPPVGSPAWIAKYPDPYSAAFPPNNMPQAWIDALNTAVAAGKIPKVPVATMGPSGNPVYPNNLSPTSATVCSATYQCRGAGDLWDAPAGTVGLSFDDGPLPTSPPLYAFLKANNQHATHFFIGSNVLYYPNEFLQAFQDNQDDICIHTYTHPYMTTKTNLEVLAELGYTAQIISDSTGGLVPKYWRPPYGDVDNRVRAIAKEVFGLTTVVWNQDSSDWELSNHAISQATVEASIKSWYTGPKSPGLIILEHELSTGSVQAFIDTYPILKANGWNAMTIPEVSSDPSKAWYQNALNDTSPVTPQGLVVQAGSASLSSSSAAPSQSSGSSSHPASPSSTSKPSSSSGSSSPAPTKKSSASRLYRSSAYALAAVAGVFAIML